MRHGPVGVADTAEVEHLYSVASHGPPLSETEETASMFARLYGWLRSRPDLITVEARSREGTLVGFSYGHRWFWAEQTDPWSNELRERLGEDAAGKLDGTFVVYLLAVDPQRQRTGLGRRLLRSLLEASGAPGAWLQTRDEETPAKSLCVSEGWRPIGHGPNAPNGRPGLVMARY